MKTKKLTHLPKCDLCGEAAEYDCKTVDGPFAFLCPTHFNTHGTTVGVRLAERDHIDPVNQGKTVQGIEDTGDEYLEFIIMGDGLREVTCPLCDDVRSLEPDAWDFNCECGALVKCPGVC